MVMGGDQVELTDVRPGRLDRAAFGEWIRPHWPAMSRLAVRLAGPGEGEDVLQDALGLAWRKRESFDAARGAARTP